MSINILQIQYHNQHNKFDFRVLIINEEIEIELDCDDSYHLDVSPPTNVENHASEIPQTVIENRNNLILPESSDTKNCELVMIDNDDKIKLNGNTNQMPTLREIKPKSPDVAAYEGIQKGPSETHEISDHDVHLNCNDDAEDVQTEERNIIDIDKIILFRSNGKPEHYYRKFRKIAPMPIKAATQVSENWRVNPPKRYKNKNVKHKIENFAVGTFSDKNKIVKSNKTSLNRKKVDNNKNGSKRKIRKIKFRSENLESSLGANQKESPLLKCEYMNSLIMEDIDEEDFIIPPMDESKSAEAISSMPESESDPQLLLCPFCTYKNPKELVLRRHMTTFHIKCFICSECFYSASSTEKLVTHISECHDKALCRLCNETLYPSSVRNHLYKCYTNKTIMRCIFCNFKVVKKSLREQFVGLREHVVAFHSRSTKDEFRCPICNFKTPIDLEMKSHFYLSHSDNKGNFFNCIDCTFIASSLTNLLLHVVAHKNEKRYFCVSCKFSNSSMSWMNFHKKLHNSVMSYKCPYCSGKVRENYLLKYHIRKCHKKFYSSKKIVE